MRQIVECDTPYCTNKILLQDSDDPENLYIFCPKCKDEHSPKVLEIQADHKKNIKEVILDSRIFKSANGMADYIGISFVTMYNWIQKYFKMTFQEFRRYYICKSDKCYILNIKRSSYSRNDYILKKIRTSGNYCACVNSLEPDHIMTNCPQTVVSSILRGFPRIARISDYMYALAPKPLLIKEHYPIVLKKLVKPIHILSDNDI